MGRLKLESWSCRWPYSAWLQLALFLHTSQLSPPPRWNGRLGPSDLSCKGAATHPYRLTQLAGYCGARPGALAGLVYWAVGQRRGNGHVAMFISSRLACPAQMGFQSSGLAPSPCACVRKRSALCASETCSSVSQPVFGVWAPLRDPAVLLGLRGWRSSHLLSCCFLSLPWEVVVLFCSCTVCRT